MSLVYVIEDEVHAELCGEHATFEAAVTEFERRAAIPWDQPPNVAPCMSWKTCGRIYEIVEYEASGEPWRELRRTPVVEVNARGVFWAVGFAR